ncbi:MAG: hypothetical protein KAS32_16445, partial [Candidatus Peribacteraceae bacterium]|nr:hypothetical protein [Candidatus Peribacteraceae bacterium]
SAQPISGMEIGRTCGIDDSQGVRVCGDYEVIPQVASQSSRENAKLFGDRRNCGIPPYWGAPLVTSYVNVTVWDTALNTVYYEKEVAGWIGGFVNFLEDIWNGLCGAFSAAANAVAAAMSIIGAIIEDIIMSAIDTILSSIEGLIQNTMINLGLWISDFIDNSVFDSSSSFGNALALYAIIAGLVTLIMVLLYALEIVEIATKVLMAVFTGGAANAAAEIFITLVKPAIISAIIGATIVGVIGSVGSILKPDEDIITEPFSEAGDAIGLIGGLFGIIFSLMEWRLLKSRGDITGLAKMGVAIELIGLAILLCAPDNGIFLLAADIIGFSLVMIGAFIFVKYYNSNPLSKIAGYTTLLEVILTGASIAGSIMEIAEHAINGRWSDG